MKNHGNNLSNVNLSENKYSKKKIIVTSALPYANGEIHIGHIVSTYLPADIFTRYNKLKGNRIIHICATDDFGTPILIRAEEEHKTPKEYVEHWFNRDLKDFKDIGICFDIFSQTSSDINIKIAQYFFKKLHDNGYIYKKNISQYFCANDNKFLPDRYVIGKCPFCNALEQYSDGCEKCGRIFNNNEILDPKCIICKEQPKFRETEHYFFRLSKFSDKLENWLTNNSNLPSEIKNYVLNWIKNGLNDWDITRDIKWGIPIPISNINNKVLYGWFENHLCYISSVLAYFSDKNEDGKEFWNSSDIYHFIGKDIVYHHYLFLPAMRMGVDQEYKLPDFIPVRGHLKLENQKISKSRGWYISLREFINSFNPDYLRYYCSSITPNNQKDVNFSWNEFKIKINNELVANVGNFINRTLTFINSKYNGSIPEPKNFDSQDKIFIRKINSIAKEVEIKIQANDIDKALRTIMEFSSYCNQYFQSRTPWKEETNSVNTIYLCFNAVKTLAIILKPYLPFTISKLLKNINLDEKELEWDDANKIDIKPQHKIMRTEILFNKITEDEIELQKNKHKNTENIQ